MRRWFCVMVSVSAGGADAVEFGAGRAGAAGADRAGRRGVPNAEIARRTGTSRPTVVGWRGGYDRGRDPALQDLPRGGRYYSSTCVDLAVSAGWRGGSSHQDWGTDHFRPRSRRRSTQSAAVVPAGLHHRNSSGSPLPNAVDPPLTQAEQLPSLPCGESFRMLARSKDTDTKEALEVTIRFGRRPT